MIEKNSSEDELVAQVREKSGADWLAASETLGENELMAKVQGTVSRFMEKQGTLANIVLEIQSIDQPPAVAAVFEQVRIACAHLVEPEKDKPISAPLSIGMSLDRADPASFLQYVRAEREKRDREAANPPPKKNPWWKIF